MIEMRIIENPNAWWRFLVPIRNREGESKNQYLLRAKRLILAFNREYTDKRPPIFKGMRDSQLYRIYGNFPLDKLTGEGLKYKYFAILRHFERPWSDEGGYDVRFEGHGDLYVEPDPEISIEKEAGIVSIVGSIQDDKTKRRKSDLEFIKGLWRNLEYRYK
jgi:hypothetical protein